MQEVVQLLKDKAGLNDQILLGEKPEISFDAFCKKVETALTHQEELPKDAKKFILQSVGRGIGSAA